MKQSIQAMTLYVVTRDNTYGFTGHTIKAAGGDVGIILKEEGVRSKGILKILLNGSVITTSVDNYTSVDGQPL